jgi:ABC-2 type transport system permease protein
MSTGTTVAARGAGYLSGSLAVMRRELGQYFDSKIAWVFTIAFLLLANSSFMNEFFLAGVADMRAFFDAMPLLLPLFLSALTMRLFAEERRTRTLEFLLTLPLSPSQVLLGKVAAALAVFAIFLAGTLPIVAMLESLGDPDLGAIAAGYLGVLLCGVFLIFLGAMVSAFSADQIVTFVATAVASYFLILCGDERVVAILDGAFDSAAIGSWLRASLSPLPHLEEFTRGIVALDAVVYFGGGSALFAYVTCAVLRRRRD